MLALARPDCGRAWAWSSIMTANGWRVASAAWLAGSHTPSVVAATGGGVGVGLGVGTGLAVGGAVAVGEAEAGVAEGETTATRLGAGLVPGVPRARDARSAPPTTTTAAPIASTATVRRRRGRGVGGGVLVTLRGILPATVG